MRMKHFIFTLCTIFVCAVSITGCSKEENDTSKPTFTVSFDSQGGSEVPSQEVTQGEKATKPSNPTKEGFAFGGWYTSTENITVWNFETDVVTKNLTLYAKWVKEDEITREMLDEAVKEARKYKEEDYTEDSYKLLEQKITAATNILGKSNATTEEIATAYAELKEAINQLIPLGKRQTTNISIAPAPVDGIVRLSTEKLKDPSPNNSYVRIEAWGEDICGGKSTNSTVSFSYDETKLKSWTKDGEIKEDRERGTLGFSPNPDLEIGESVEITVTSADDTGLKTTFKLTVCTPEEIKSLFLEAVEGLSSAQQINFDTYFEVNGVYNRCLDIYNSLSWSQQNKDADIKAAKQTLDGFEENFDGWWHVGYIQMDKDKYVLGENDATFTAEGNFPCGTFVTIHDIPEDGTLYGKESMTLKADYTFLEEYGEGSDISQIPSEPNMEGEYRLYQGDSKQGIFIFHPTREYDSYSKAARQYFHK